MGYTLDGTKEQNHAAAMQKMVDEFRKEYTAEIASLVENFKDRVEAEDFERGSDIVEAVENHLETHRYVVFHYLSILVCLVSDQEDNASHNDPGIFAPEEGFQNYASALASEAMKLEIIEGLDDLGIDVNSYGEELRKTMAHNLSSRECLPDNLWNMNRREIETFLKAKGWSVKVEPFSDHLGGFFYDASLYAQTSEGQKLVFDMNDCHSTEEAAVCMLLECFVDGLSGRYRAQGYLVQCQPSLNTSDDSEVLTFKLRVVIFRP